MMPDAFHTKIRTSLGNDGLQSALDANSLRRVALRNAAFASLPDAEDLRQRAHHIRADVIANLDDYLERFIHQVQSNGVIVHRAVDARQAVEIVLDIARQTGEAGEPARRIVKSKTMVSEEMHLNHALEAAGMQVLETDLGEFIVQLRDEPPGHIITPAVHLRRSDVGATFHEKLGIPYTDDIPTMTATARRVLREAFLAADIGISGVNFGVAETGALCLVTNEGNGRMVTTLPPVHIALMGMERLVPTMDDLAVMLELLPRSATGQKISVYTSLVRAPRHPGDPDGAEQRHLVIVDNGRSALCNSPYAEALYCIRCGACLNACPIFREIGGHAYVSEAGAYSPYTGPIGSVLSPALFGQAEFGHLARASSLCGACKDACPVDIDIPKMLLRMRAGQPVSGEKLPPQPNPPSKLALGLRLYTWMAISPRRFSAIQYLAGFFAGLATLFSSRQAPQGGTWLRLPALTGWGFSKDFPRPTSKPFRARFNEHIPSAVQPITGLRTLPEEPEQATSGMNTQGMSLVERFVAELTALEGVFKRCEAGQLASTILELLHDRGADALLAWEAEWLPAGLLDEIKAAGIRVVHTVGNRPIDDGQLPRVGLTGALAGLAETGSLVLTGGPGRPLTASLVPSLHIALLRSGDLYASLAEVLQLIELKEAPAAALISGPSRTADIEMTLTLGVHGPREVYVLCYDG